MQTDDLIMRLAHDAALVQPLRTPWMRTMSWLVVAVAVTAAIVLAMSPRPDLAERARDTGFLTEQLAALATAILAAHAALALSVPGTSRLVAAAPVVPAAVWLLSQGAGCIRASTWQGLSGEPECLALIALCGTVPAVVLVRMLRRGFAVNPRLNLCLAVLASAALGNVALRLFHMQDAALMVLVWQTGSVVLLTVCGWLFGRVVLLVPPMATAPQNH